MLWGEICKTLINEFTIYKDDFGLYIGVSARGCIWPSLRHLVPFFSKMHFLFEEYFSWFVNSGVMAVKWLIAFRLFLSKSVTLLRFSWLLFMMFLLGWIGCWFDRLNLLVKLILTKNLNNVFFFRWFTRTRMGALIRCQRCSSMQSYRGGNGDYWLFMMMVGSFTLPTTNFSAVPVWIIIGRFFPEAQISRMDFKPVQPGASGDPFDSHNGMISQVDWHHSHCFHFHFHFWFP